jgi:hypothetical protein
MEMFKVDDNDIQGRLEFNKEWWSAAQEGEPMAGDEIREVRWMIEQLSCKVKESDRLRKELEEAHDALHKIAAGEWEESMDNQFNDVFTTRTINPAQIANEALAALGQEGEGNQCR